MQKQKQQKQSRKQQSSSPEPVAAETASSSEVAAAPSEPVTREFTALGSKVVESNVAFKGPEDEKDFWEGDKFDGEECLWHVASGCQAGGSGGCLAVARPNCMESVSPAARTKQQSQFLLRHTSAPAAILPAGVTLAASHPMSLLLCAAFGKALENYFIPGLIALGVVCGGIAAKSYNDGATAFVKP